jgi:hypothetical protein
VSGGVFLMLSRETGVSGEEGGAGRWSLDHLLLDQDAIPRIDIPASALTGKPRASLGVFAEESALLALFDALQWFIDEARVSDGG